MGIADGYIDPHGVLAPASFARRSPGEGSLPIGQRPVRTRCIGACWCGRYTSSTLQLAPAWHETGLVATLGRSAADAEGSVWIPLILTRDACHLGETARHRHPGRVWSGGEGSRGARWRARRGPGLGPQRVLTFTSYCPPHNLALEPEAARNFRGLPTHHFRPSSQLSYSSLLAPPSQLNDRSLRAPRTSPSAFRHSRRLARCQNPRSAGRDAQYSPVAHRAPAP